MCWQLIFRKCEEFEYENNLHISEIHIHSLIAVAFFAISLYFRTEHERQNNCAQSFIRM